MASLLMIASGIISGIFGYVFQIIIGRILSPGEYSLFVAMMAIASIFGSMLSTISMMIAKEVAINLAEMRGGKNSALYFQMNFQFAMWGIVLLFIYFYLSPLIQNYLNADDIFPIYMLGILLFILFPVAINNAFLQGAKQFSWLAVGGILAAIVKIGFPLLFFYLGFGFSGIVGGVVAMYCASWLFSLFGLKGFIEIQPYARGQPILRSSWRSALPIFLANVAFAFMTQFDVVLVNHYFPADTAGLYASASILGKAILYLPGGLALALFPFSSENKALGKSGNHLLVQALLFTLILCLFGSFFYFLFSREVLILFYGEQHLGASPLLKYYGFAILPISIVMVIEHFLIARGRILFAYIFALVAPLQLFLTSIFHETPSDILVIMGGCGVLLIVLGSIFLLQILKSDNACATI
jgi:O-antigen/teichoic acid export membrane protein